MFSALFSAIWAMTPTLLMTSSCPLLQWLNGTEPWGLVPSAVYLVALTFYKTSIGWRCAFLRWLRRLNGKLATDSHRYCTIVNCFLMETFSQQAFQVLYQNEQHRNEQYPFFLILSRNVCCMSSISPHLHPICQQKTPQNGGQKKKNRTEIPPRPPHKHRLTHTHKHSNAQISGGTTLSVFCLLCSVYCTPHGSSAE